MYTRLLYIFGSCFFFKLRSTKLVTKRMLIKLSRCGCTESPEPAMLRVSGPGTMIFESWRRDPASPLLLGRSQKLCSVDKERNKHKATG